MPRGAKYLLLAVLLISFAVFAPGPASAGHPITVVMDEAYYDDLDGDGSVDDIVVIYEVIPPDKDSYEEYVIELYCRLTLPSGLSFIYECAVVTTNGCVVTQYWFDAAHESGWYSYSVYAYSFVSDVDPTSAEIVFDPPSGGEGDPMIDTVIVELGY